MTKVKIRRVKKATRNELCDCACGRIEYVCKCARIKKTCSSFLYNYALFHSNTITQTHTSSLYWLTHANNCTKKKKKTDKRRWVAPKRKMLRKHEQTCTVEEKMPLNRHKNSDDDGTQKTTMAHNDDNFIVGEVKRKIVAFFFLFLHRLFSQRKRILFCAKCALKTQPKREIKETNDKFNSINSIKLKWALFCALPNFTIEIISHSEKCEMWSR